MERFTGLLGIVVILGIALIFSKDRKAINLRLVFSGLALQTALAVFVLKTAIGQAIFAKAGGFPSPQCLPSQKIFHSNRFA